MKCSNLILAQVFILVNDIIFGQAQGSSDESGNQYENSLGTAWRKSSSDEFRYSNGTGTGSRFATKKIKEYLVTKDAGYLFYPDTAHRGYIYAAGAAMEYNDIKYFWGRRYYRENSDNFMCSYPIEEYDQVFGILEFRTGGVPKEIVYGCDLDNTCCGLECCDKPTSLSKGWVVFICLVILVLIVILFCIVKKLFVVYALTCVCPWQSDFEESMPSSKAGSTWRVDTIHDDVTTEPTKVKIEE